MKNTFDCPLRVGQRVRHTDHLGQRVTGVIYGLSVCHERGLMVDCRLDAPIVIPSDEHSPSISIWNQYGQAHEFTAFDERDELVDELVGTLDACRNMLADLAGCPGIDVAMQAKLQGRITTVSVAIAKVTGRSE